MQRSEGSPEAPRDRVDTASRDNGLRKSNAGRGQAEYERVTLGLGTTLS